LGDKGFIEWVRKKLGDKARVEEAKPESRRVFGLGIEEIARATGGFEIPEIRRIPSAASCGEYDPKRFNWNYFEAGAKLELIPARQ
jgi:hypothetical protein